MRRKQFWLGFAFYFCIDQFRQDAIGKEKFLELTRLLWIETPWALWLGIAILILVASEIRYSSKGTNHDAHH